MPNTRAERAARRHIARLRRMTPTTPSFDVLPPSPDDHLALRYRAALAHALADLMEYHVDVSGGIDGVATLEEYLLLAIADLPRPLCEGACVDCAPPSICEHLPPEVYRPPAAA